MDLGLRDKLAVVSGSTAGIGLTTAAALAAECARVVVNGRTQARVAAAVKTIQRVAGTNLRGVAADLGTSAGVESFLRQVPAADVLVNNLGIFEPKPFLEIPDADWVRFFEVNVLSGVRLARAYLPGMQKKNWGRIIFISSESAQQIPAEMIHCGMTKTAQVAIARGIAESVAGQLCPIPRVERDESSDWRHSRTRRETNAGRRTKPANNPASSFSPFA